MFVEFINPLNKVSYRKALRKVMPSGLEQKNLHTAEPVVFFRPKPCASAVLLLVV